MRKCFAMFILLVLMLIASVIIDNSNKLIINDKFVENELAAENELLNELVSDSVFKK